MGLRVRQRVVVDGVVCQSFKVMEISLSGCQAGMAGHLLDFEDVCPGRQAVRSGRIREGVA